MRTLLLVGSGFQETREYILRAVAPRYRLVLLQDSPVTWQQPYVADHAAAPWGDEDAVVAAARALAQRHDVRGVFTYEEMSLELAAAVAEALELPHLSVACARLCRDKHGTRQALAAAGVPSARSRLAPSVDEAFAAAAEIGYPVVLKPRTLAGSVSVVRVDGPGALAEAFEMAAGTTIPRFRHEPGALVEEYLDGPEVSVESAVFDGAVEVVAITRKALGFPPYFEEVGHVVSLVDPLPDEAAVREVTVAAHRALDLRWGVTHTEVKLTRSGPRIVEVNGRLGGDLIPYLVYLAGGVDLAVAAADIAAGVAPDLAPTRRAAAAVRCVYPSVDSRVVALGVDPAAAALPWLDRIIWAAAPGHGLRLPPRDFVARLCYLIVTGADAAECEARLDEAQRLIRADLQPLAEGEEVPAPH